VKIKRLFILALFAVVARLAFGYVREFDNNGIPLAWVWDHTVVMQLSLGTGNRTLRDGFTSFNDSAIDALQTWNPYLAHLRFSWVRNSPVTPTKGDDEISVIFDSKVFGSNFGTGALAVTTLASRNGTLEETDTVFNNAISWDSYRGPLTPPVFDFRRVAIHDGHLAFRLVHRHQLVDAVHLRDHGVDRGLGGGRVVLPHLDRDPRAHDRLFAREPIGVRCAAGREKERDREDETAHHGAPVWTNRRASHNGYTGHSPRFRNLSPCVRSFGWALKQE